MFNLSLLRFFLLLPLLIGCNATSLDQALDESGILDKGAKLSLGNDRNLILPDNSITIDPIGKGIDTSIAGYEWQKLSGPSAGKHSSLISKSITLTELVAGQYVYQLTVIDSEGVKVSDSISITVHPHQIENMNAQNGEILSVPLPSTFTGRFEALVEASAVEAISHGLFSFGLDLKNFDQMPTMIRFNKTGILDVRSGDAYIAQTNIVHQKEKSHLFRVIVDLASREYDVYVKPDGEEEVILQAGAAFRTTASSVSNFSHFSVYGQFSGINVKLISVKTTTKKLVSEIAPDPVLPKPDPVDPGPGVANPSTSGENINFPVVPETYGTFASAGYRIKKIPTNIVGAEVWFKKRIHTNWRRALDPIIAKANARYDGGSTDKDIVDKARGTMIHRLHGSLFNIDAKTKYDIMIRLKQSNNSFFKPIYLEVDTREDVVKYDPNGKILLVGAGGQYPKIEDALAAAQPGNIIQLQPGTHTSKNGNIIVSKSGLPGKPIVIRGHKDATILNTNSCWLFNLEGTLVSDVVFENLKIKGTIWSSDCVANRIIYAKGNTERVVIQNVDVEFAQDNNRPVVVFGFIGPKNVETIIQNNIVRGKGFTSSTSNYIIMMSNHKGLVFRNNDIRVGLTYDVASFGANEDTDIYNNHFEGVTEDDGIELERGANVNLRFFNNKVMVPSGKKGTISNIPSLVGPTYVFRNLFRISEQAIKVVNSTIIADVDDRGIDYEDFGPTIYMHNTFHSDKLNDQLFRSSSLCHTYIVLKNNIFYGRRIQDKAIRGTAEATKSSSSFGILEVENNIFWDGTTTTNPNASYGIDITSIFANPQLVSPTNAQDVNLKSNSPAINKGIILPNINDGFKGSAPDIGMFENF
jgi:hypothetical protein